ncbi:MAG: hypothetical protein WC915_02040 [archaeon]|jgi:hypothetical protein
MLKLPKFIFSRKKVFNARPLKKGINLKDLEKFSKRIWNTTNGWQLFRSGSVLDKEFESSQKHRFKKPHIVFRDLSPKSFKELKIDQEYTLEELQEKMHLDLTKQKGLSKDIKYICVQKGIQSTRLNQKKELIPEVHFVKKRFD